MDKLSEHAIRMLEIADANDIPVFGNNQIQDISRAVYDIILQVQMLKMADRNCSEKPNNCETCGTPKHLCQYCIAEDRMWTPPQTERSSK